MTTDTHTAAVAVVTGANKGIGKQIARGLARADVVVYAAARDPERGKAAVAELAADGDVRELLLDVTDRAGISAAADRVRREAGHLDLLVNNAAVAEDVRLTPASLPEEDLRRVYETNVFGLIAVTGAFLPLLRRSGGARIINLSTELASLTRCSDPSTPQHAIRLLAYNSSKTAVNALTVQYANELRDSGIDVVAVSPGYVATDLNGFQGFLSPEQGAAPVVAVATGTVAVPSGSFSGQQGPLPW